MVSSTTERLKYQRMLSILGIAFAIWILGFYLLPSTPISKISPFSWDTDIFLVGSNSFAHRVILSIVSLAILWIYWWKIDFGTKESALVGLISVYIALYLFTTFTSGDNTAEIENCFKYVTAISTGLLAALISGRPRNITLSIIALATLQGVMTLYYHHVGQNDLFSGEVRRAGGTYNDPTAVYIVMMLALPLIATRLATTQSEMTRSLLSVSAAVVLAALFVTWYRGGIVAVAVSLTWLYYCMSKQWKTTLIVGVIAGLLTVIPFFVRTNGTINNASSTRSVDGRYILWQKGVEIFEHHWMNGTGVASLAIPVVVHGPGGPRKSGSMEPKNIFLFWLDEMGIGGGILFVLFVWVIGRIVTTRPTVLHHAIGASWLALLAAGLFDTPFGPANRLYSGAIVGALLGATIMLNRQENTVIDTSLDPAGAANV